MAERNQETDLAKRLEKAFANPLRAHILAVLNDAPASSVDLAERFSEPANKIRYHLAVLEDLECIKHIDSVEVRGVDKKIYAGITRMLITPDTWAELSYTARHEISMKILGETIERVEAALAAGTFDKRDDRIAANYKARLDEQGWKETLQDFEALHHRLLKREDEAVERKPDHLDRTPFTFTLLAYQSPPGNFVGGVNR